jgi:hypothetical protein
MISCTFIELLYFAARCLIFQRVSIAPLRRAAGSAACFELELPEPNILGVKIANSLRVKRIAVSFVAA